jgi:hypothetical protein
MAVTTTPKVEARNALANKAIGASGGNFRARWVVFEDESSTVKRWLAPNSAVAIDGTLAYKYHVTGTGTAPAGCSTYCAKVYILGDVGTLTLESQLDALAVVAGADVTFQTYVMQTTVYTLTDRKAITAGDPIYADLTMAF